MKGTMMAAAALSLGMALMSPVGARAQEPAGGLPRGMGAGYAMPREQRMEMRRHRMDMMRELDLSKEQRERIMDLREKHERAAIRMRADLQTARLDLEHLVRADRTDRVAINRQIDRIAQMRAEMEKARLGTMLDVRSVLTPEQRERARDRERGPGREPESQRESEPEHRP